MKTYTVVDVMGADPGEVWVRRSDALAEIDQYARKTIDALKEAQRMDILLHEALAGGKVGMSHMLETTGDDLL